MYMYIPFIILYNTALTDQSSNNHIPLDNGITSHAPTPPPSTYCDTMNQKVYYIHV